MPSSNELITQSAVTLAQHELLAPGLLFVAGHQPLAFVTGQILHILAPAAGMLGFSTVHAWATLLSDPQQVAQLQRALEDAATDRA